MIATLNISPLICQKTDGDIVTIAFGIAMEWWASRLLLLRVLQNCWSESMPAKDNNGTGCKRILSHTEMPMIPYNVAMQ